ncbi:MAG: non-ribosomal peptide synthetase [Rariglobus sp.]|jgi:amino acid adenylation domain-containing protein|nr:non-ribosomal peptide synthetase [Rariglobus sp.]
MSLNTPNTVLTEDTTTIDHGLTLSPEDRERVLVDWNRTEVPYPRTACLHDRFQAQAAVTPDAEALVVGHERLTYGELNRRANRVAHRLRALGVGPETLVGIFLPRTSDMMAALFGVLKSGGAYVPLDPVYPADRLSFILQDARVHTVLTCSSHSGALDRFAAATGSGPNVVCLDTDEQLALAPDSNPGSLAAPENLAYVIYTSGSTGRPKGVCLEHRNAVAFVQWGGGLYSPRELSGVVATATICFDASVLELFVPLSFGGKVIIAENALAVPGLPAVNEIHLMDTVPSAVRELLRNGGLPTSLETINLGGEAVPDDLVRALYELPHIKRVYDQYGPTETTVVATCALRDPDEPGTIGRPIANTRVYLLDDSLEPVGLGEAGELFIGGACVARGYLNRPDLTTARFLPDPFSPAPEARMYRTGDVCRYLPDGRLKFLGRADQQVKIRGFRIELGEIESVLASCPAVGQAVVRLWSDPQGAKKLAAYVVPSAGQPAPSERQLRDYLRQHLPGYMIPAAVVFLERLPLTPNGKIDSNALPAPSRSRGPDSGQRYRRPRNPTEESLCLLWSRRLDVENVGINDNFFDIGGDSLAGAAMLAEVEKISGRKFPHDIILKAPTVARLAAVLDGKAPASGADDVSLVGVQTQGSLPRLFLVHGIGGGMLWGYANLSRHLGAEQPVYVFTAPELDNGRPSPSIAAMAERYVEELRRFQSHGPYCLGGYCFGGNIAYEMARILRDQGQEVALLALFNCWPSSSSYDRFRWTPVHLFKFAQNLVFWGGRFIQWEPRTRRDFLRWKFRSLKRKLATWLRLQAAPSGIDVEAEVDVSRLSEAEQRLWREHTLAMANHQTGPYEGGVTLFRTRGHPFFCSYDHQCGWGELALGGVTVKILPGQHETLMTEPHVGFLARALQSDLAAVARRPSTLLLTAILGVTAFFTAASESTGPHLDDGLISRSHSRTTELEFVQGEGPRTTRRTARGYMVPA